MLFEGGAGETIRRKLLRECDLHTLLRLPTGIFYAGGVKANVLFFDRKPPSERPWTDKLWIYDFRTNRRFTLKTRALVRADLDDFVTCYNPGNRHERVETERFPALSFDELVALTRRRWTSSGCGMSRWRTRRTCRPRRSSRPRSWRTCRPPWTSSR